MEKVLVCLLASTRSHQLTFPSFKRRVLDELNGDLALALAIDEKYEYANPFWQHAKYRWTVPDFSDYGEAFDLVQRWLCGQHDVHAPDWRPLLRIGGLWKGRIRSAPDPQLGGGAVLLFCRWLLLRGLQDDDVLDRYDRFVITRSDFVWLCPHPPLSVLDRGAIWFPNGEHYGGFTDRHLVVSRADVVNCLNVIDDLLLHPAQLYEEMRHQSEWNIEQLLARHLASKGLIHKVKLFPYVMYTAWSVRTTDGGWWPGRYEPEVGHYVKYQEEFRTASAYATIIRSRADWEHRAWADFDPELAPVPLRRRLRNAYETWTWPAQTRKILSALRRTGRGRRFLRLCKRMVR
jgi:hypothetical protein